MRGIYCALYMLAATIVLCVLCFQVSNRDDEIERLGNRLSAAREQIAEGIIGFEACKLMAGEYEKCQATIRHYGIRQ